MVGSFTSEPAPSHGNGQGPALGLSPLAVPVGLSPASGTNRAPKNE